MSMPTYANKYPTAAGVGKVFKKSSTKPVEQVGNK
jgi:hypothetical protein